jgi:hypothetical protein
MQRTLILILALIAFTYAQDPQTYNFECGRIEREAEAARKFADTEYIKGDKMFLCLHFAPFGIKIPFRLVVDEYNMIEVKRCKK